MAVNPTAQAVVDAMARAVRTKRRPLPLHEPRFSGREWEYVKRCLDSGWVSSVGEFVTTFESKLAQSCGVKHAVVTVNGTAALHIALKLSDVCAGDEVILPSLTFVATANAVTYCNAVPHFVDSEEDGLGIDPSKLSKHLEAITERRGDALINKKTGRRIRAIVPVHVFGHPSDMNAISIVARNFGLTVIEDATESLGSTYHRKPCGSLALAGVLSFNGNKIITTGGGGAIVTDDEAFARRAKHLTTTAKIPHAWAFIHDEIGWNYRLPNINAALGVAQLEELDKFVTAKRRLASRYIQAFEQIDGITFIQEPAHTMSNYWLNSILLDDDSGKSRDDILQAAHDAGFLVRPAWTPLHKLKMFADCPRANLTAAESIERRLISLPSSAILGDE